MSHRIQLRRDKAAFWAQENPVLADGELAWVKDANNPVLKIGDGETPFNELPNILSPDAPPANLQDSIPGFNYPVDTNEPNWFEDLEPGFLFTIDEYEDESEEVLNGRSLNYFLGVDEDSNPLYDQLLFVPEPQEQEPVQVFPTEGDEGDVLAKSGNEGEVAWVKLQGKKSEETTSLVNSQLAEAPIEPIWASAFGNGTYVLIGRGQEDPDKVVTSTDGITWTQQTTPAGAFFRDATFGAGLFVAVGGGLHNVMTSPDGTEWTVREGGPGIALDCIVYNPIDGLFVALGGARAVTSSDGINWNAHIIPLGTWKGVTYANGQYIAVGYEGKILISTNATNWVLAPAFTSEDFVDIDFKDGRFVLVSFQGGIFSSENGTDWNRRYQLMNSNSLGHDGNYWLVIGMTESFGDVFLLSDDGISWLAFDSVTQDLKTIISGEPGVFIVAGDSGLTAGFPIQVVTLGPNVPRIRLNQITGNYYGNDSAISGNLLIDTSNAVLGGMARILHNSPEEPDFLGQFTIDVKKGNYVPNENNFIWIRCTDHENTPRVEIEILSESESSELTGDFVTEESLQDAIEEAIDESKPYLTFLSLLGDTAEVIHSANPGFESIAVLGNVPAARFQRNQIFELNLDYTLQPNGSTPVVRLGFCGVDIKMPTGSLPFENTLTIHAVVEIIFLRNNTINEDLIYVKIKATSYESYIDEDLEEDVLHFPGDFLGKVDILLPAQVTTDQSFDLKFDADEGVTGRLISAHGFSRFLN